MLDLVTPLMKNSVQGIHQVTPKCETHTLLLESVLSYLTYFAGTVPGMSSVALRELTSHKRLVLFHTQ